MRDIVLSAVAQYVGEIQLSAAAQMYKAILDIFCELPTSNGFYLLYQALPGHTRPVSRRKKMAGRAICPKIKGHSGQNI